jgi:hypothetical protein
MSREFNYARAWKDYVAPEFTELHPSVNKAFLLTMERVNELHQEGACHALTGVTQDLMNLFEKVPAKHLAWASQVVYYYGHLSPSGTAQEGGLYWKFQIIADTVLFRHGANEDVYQAKQKMQAALDNFNDHKEGSEYADDEVPERISVLSPNIGAGAISILKVDCVNFKPDMFCIGPQHFPKDGSMYIKPEQAPCAHCKQDYKAHTHDRVMFVKILTENQDDVKTALQRIIDLCKEQSIRLDGFVPVEG